MSYLENNMKLNKKQYISQALSKGFKKTVNVNNVLIVYLVFSITRGVMRSKQKKQLQNYWNEMLQEFIHYVETKIPLKEKNKAGVQINDPKNVVMSSEIKNSKKENGSFQEQKEEEEEEKQPHAIKKATEDYFPDTISKAFEHKQKYIKLLEDSKYVDFIQHIVNYIFRKSSNMNEVEKKQIQPFLNILPNFFNSIIQSQAYLGTMLGNTSPSLLFLNDIINSMFFFTSKTYRYKTNIKRAINRQAPLAVPITTTTSTNIWNLVTNKYDKNIYKKLSVADYNKDFYTLAYSSFLLSEHKYIDIYIHWPLERKDKKLYIGVSLWSKKKDPQREYDIFFIKFNRSNVPLFSRIAYDISYENFFGVPYYEVNNKKLFLNNLLFFKFKKNITFLFKS